MGNWIKKTIYFGCLIFGILIYSCGSVNEKLYGVNKNIAFYSKEDVVKRYEKTSRLEKKAVYFISNERVKDDFLLNEVDPELMPYYALVIDDSTKVDDSQIGEKTCIGTIDKFVLDYQGNGSLIKSDLRKLKLVNYLNEPLDLNRKNPTLVFVISTNMGKMINVTANYVTDHLKKQKKEINCIYIAIDPILPKPKTK